ncbi:acyl-protein thioesterase 1 [Eurytemora carolleeae]|uniref:acyl-protein thioesterase 1 n=1 Tax=Eurytemora carolleeae TaxID=1294199 RepID=UPI000C7725B7|nr:acyl-protein thioesterase 1 [Eurytemora carolleeae]|eukprot:XP_023332641.1 acyl-protein thioesterase 1-like [Eurytemora affinis]
MNIPPVILNASARHTATLVFLHGLGDTGLGWAGALNTIKPDFLKVICPTAPMLPVTINGGAAMPAWYDITSLDEKDEKREDSAGVDWAVDYLMNIVKGEEKHGIQADRVMIGGFSQGGAVSLRATLTSENQLAGCVALSCYLPGNISALKKRIVDTPVFQAHGDSDSVVSFARGAATSSIVKSMAGNHKFVTYPGMGHEATPAELEDIKKFLLETFKQ